AQRRRHHALRLDRSRDPGPRDREACVRQARRAGSSAARPLAAGLWLAGSRDRAFRTRGNELGATDGRPSVHVKHSPSVDAEEWDWSQHVVDHVEIHASNYDASVAFYNTVLTPLGIPSWPEDWEHERSTCFTRVSVVDRQPPTFGLHLCFVAR